MNAHTIPIHNMSAPYVRTGYEAILPIRVSDKYVINAEDDGVVVKVTKSEVEVNYKKLGNKKYTIKDWTTKEESDSCYYHVMAANVQAGDKFIKDDTLIYDTAFFQQDIFNPRRVIYMQGDMVTVALVEDPETHEDSAGISQAMNKYLGTTVTKIKSVVVTKEDNIYNLKPIGTELTPADALFSITSGSVPMGVDAETLAILERLNTKSPKAKVNGKILKIEVRYNCNLEDMTSSLQEIVKESDKKLKYNTGYTGKVEGSYSIKGVPLLEGQVEIKVYIAVDNPMGLGDKAILGNQVKFTVGDVFPSEVSGEDGTPIDVSFSTRSIAARIVNSPMLIGTTSMCLEQLGKKAVEMYFGKQDK